MGLRRRLRERPAGWVAMLIVVAGVVAAACGGNSGTDGQLSLTFMAGFRAQANVPFVAAYVAQQEGFFDAVGLDVTIRHSTGGGEHVRLLLGNDVDVTTQPASELLQRRSDPGAPLVAVALFGQQGDIGYAVLEDSGIATPGDFAGKVVGFKVVVQSEFLALLAANGLEVDDVELISTGFNPVVLAEGQLDVYPVFLSNEPDTLERVLGAPVRVFEAAQYGVPTLGVAYVVSEELLADADRREGLRRFLAATMRGLQFAIDNPGAAIEATRAFISDEADLVHERFILDTELASAQSELTAANGPGWFTVEQFEALHDVLLEFGGIETAVDVGAALDRSFLESIYENGRLRE